eukprot:gb/GEZN01004944.1/.p1 GENE.gb/GEZN01004944.1/~~gb/GEZN01004944.1/.p1  ORF type:complete len:398 (-),score=42.07 gb/GEZN01004944.1/:682-1875(-)
MWKYGYRSFRYCNHDIGHAMMSVYFGARLQGWAATHLVGVGGVQLDALLGLDRSIDFESFREEPEFGEALLVISPAEALYDIPRADLFSYRIPTQATKGTLRETSYWYGVGNSLSRGHTNVWPDVSKMYRVTRSNLPFVPRATQLFSLSPSSSLPSTTPTRLMAGSIIRQRRSAVDMDGVTSISSAQFFEMMSRVMPYSKASPFGLLSPYDPAIHLAIFVHRVKGLDPGLYFLLRDPSVLEVTKALLQSTFTWHQCVPGLPLYFLSPMDPVELSKVAISVSCSQEIAGAGAFSLGMLAAMDVLNKERTAAAYRELYWEAGMIGQILYLEAEAKKVSGTGIGCFLDDAVHSVFLNPQSSGQLQSLYHFTVGGRTEDTRVQTLDPYEALKNQTKIDKWF